MILGLFGKPKRPEVTRILLERVVEAARAPGLYLHAGVPDTFEGRFESLTLHAFLVMHRLRQLPPPASAAAQDFIDHVFEHLDLGLRQAGISDIGVPKRMKKLAQGFYGRVEAYDAALAADDRQALEAALARNVTTIGSPALLADYVLDSIGQLSACGFDDLFRRAPIVEPLKP